MTRTKRFVKWCQFKIIWFIRARILGFEHATHIHQIKSFVPVSCALFHVFFRYFQVFLGSSGNLLNHMNHDRWSRLSYTRQSSIYPFILSISYRTVQHLNNQFQTVCFPFAPLCPIFPMSHLNAWTNKCIIFFYFWFTFNVQCWTWNKITLFNVSLNGCL